MGNVTHYFKVLWTISVFTFFGPVNHLFHIWFISDISFCRIIFLALAVFFVFQFIESYISSTVENTSFTQVYRSYGRFVLVVTAPMDDSSLSSCRRIHLINLPPTHILCNTFWSNSFLWDGQQFPCWDYHFGSVLGSTKHNEGENDVFKVKSHLFWSLFWWNPL